ncbi:MAG TPA: low molecular weight protein arginine phosphatase [Acetivibrio sp.]|uniref:low molecular weight protein arginine phosphatase n=1 Tax=Acetivibrio sp. TaxID=1872092 RepID=UPI002C1984C1|nr:low molecular weight protein arginine phosphatase [Acetivibrio sp.]HOM03530.1 low molecular weight protein arginine phosphatase [Acetivibrio sp.]
MKKVLFVCTGNTCRSSMAEGLFNHIVENGKEDLKDFRAFSAGISAFENDCANPRAIKVLKEEYNVDISSHKARRISKSDVESAYIILTMTEEHKNAVLRMFPGAADKTYTIKEYAYGDDENGDFMGHEHNRRHNMDISDPYGFPEEVYKICAKEIKDALDRIIIKFKE